MDLQRKIPSKAVIVTICVMICIAVGLSIVIPLLVKKIKEKNQLAEQNAQIVAQQTAFNEALNNAYALYYADAQDEIVDDANAYSHIIGQCDLAKGVLFADIYQKSDVLIGLDVDGETELYRFNGASWDSIGKMEVHPGDSFDATAKYMTLPLKSGMPQNIAYTHLAYGGYRIYSGR